MFSVRHLLHTCFRISLAFEIVHGLCGSSFRWSHHFNMDLVYGKWYGVGYARHSNVSGKRNEIGCVTLFIKDITAEAKDEWLDWNVVTIPRRNYTGENWRSYIRNYRSNPTLHRRAKRDMYEQRHLQIMWDEDGETLEQTYVYSPEAPGLWTAEKWELRLTGIDVWHPDDPPRQPEVIRILKSTPDLLVINHCSDADGNGVITLVLRRLPPQVDGWQSYELERELIDLELPHIFKMAPLCSACMRAVPLVLLVFGCSMLGTMCLG